MRYVLRHAFDEMALTLIGRHAHELLNHYLRLCDSADDEYLRLINDYGRILERFRKETNEFVLNLKRYHRDTEARRSSF
jgi:hypothetical protein